MNNTILIGTLLILGFVLVVGASLAGPPGLYQEPDSAKQVQLIETHMSRWTASNVLFALASIVTAVGLLLLSNLHRETVNTSLVWGAWSGYALSSVLWSLFLYQRNANPEALFSDYTFSSLTIALVALLIASLLAYGFIFLKAGYPLWLSYGIIGFMGLLGLVALIFPGPFFKWFPPQSVYLVTLVAGIVILRR